MPQLGSYDPQKVVASLAGIQLSGFAPGTFIKVSRNEDAFALAVGADGGGARTKNANRSGRIEMTFLHTAPVNDALQALYVIDDATGAGVGPFMLKDLSSDIGLVHAQNAWIMKLPDFERGKESGEITWIAETLDVEMFHSGNTF